MPLILDVRLLPNLRMETVRAQPRIFRGNSNQKPIVSPVTGPCITTS
jgi:hypothetical protein